jgi:hypothetical protein
MGRRAATAVVWATLLAAACGGSSGPGAATTTSPTASGDAAKIAELDAASFDALVLGAARPSLVEFHSPT